MHSDCLCSEGELQGEWIYLYTHAHTRPRAPTHTHTEFGSSPPASVYRASPDQILHFSQIELPVFRMSLTVSLLCSHINSPDEERRRHSPFWSSMQRSSRKSSTIQSFMVRRLQALLEGFWGKQRSGSAGPVQTPSLDFQLHPRPRLELRK